METVCNWLDRWEKHQSLDDGPRSGAPPKLDTEGYVAISRQIRDIFGRYTHLVETLSLDEAFLDVSGSRRLFGEAEQIAQRIKDEIRKEIGLVASVGVAPNKILSKIASDLEKPDGLVVVDPARVTEFLAPLPITRLWGVGKATNAAPPQCRSSRKGSSEPTHHIGSPAETDFTRRPYSAVHASTESPSRGR